MYKKDPYSTDVQNETKNQLISTSALCTSVCMITYTLQVNSALALYLAQIRLMSSTERR